MLRVSGCCIIVGAHTLLIRRGPQRTRPNEYEIPGGKIEANELPLAAALRETQEETSIDVQTTIRPVAVLYSAPAATPLMIDFEFHLFSAHLTTRPPVTLEPGHTDARWVTRREAYDLPLIFGMTEVFDLCGF